MRVLLAGGAGYIGSHTAVALTEAGHEVVIVDNFVNSSSTVVDRIQDITGAFIPFCSVDVRDEAAFLTAVREHAPIDAVIHLAGLKSVGDSVADPLEYYSVNVGATTSLMKVVVDEAIPIVIFSSSATVYGNPSSLPLTEWSPTGVDLTNPYGWSKQFGERIIRDVTVAHPQLSATALRYFNPVGADPSGLIGESPDGIPNNLMPYIVRVAAGSAAFLGVFGNDYPTPDGTGLRDYIHVSDLAAGHVAALENAKVGFHAYNLGTGNPVSVMELITAFETATGMPVPRRMLPRRPGDVAVSYCDPSLARRELGWYAIQTIAEACRDSWNWHSRNPAGYSGLAG